ncbi:MAG: hypothetical protein R2881_03075 [Eubacteriales bacterium]
MVLATARFGTSKRIKNAAQRTTRGLRQIYQRTVDGNKTFIPAKEKLNLDDPNKVVRVLRITAAYRLITMNQLSSFELQQEHYRQLIGARTQRQN